MVDIDRAGTCGPKGSVVMNASTFVQDPAPAGYVGVGGHTEFKFTATETAVKGANCNIGFMYAQPWNAPMGW